MPDNAYFDGRVADTAIATLRKLSQRDQPFFLAVGFWKPHTPFNAPKKYWDLYDREKVPVPSHVTPPADVPEIALTDSRYSGGANSELLREMHHGHLAAISYLDAQVGRVLGELNALGLRENTIIVFWSDHGLHLGEHGLTRKTTAFELDARVPLIIATPKHKPGQRTEALVELLDLYPTLTDLCELKAPREVEGVSLVPLLNDPNARGKDFALTQTPRPNYPRGKLPKVMAYSIRTQRYRYTEWRDFRTGEVQARELYDHDDDPREMANLAGHVDRSETLAELAEQLDRALSLGDETPHPVTNPKSRLMLDLRETGKDPAKIDYTELPRVPSEHAIISDVRDYAGRRVHQHAYLAHYKGRCWAMWSDGPGVPNPDLSPQQHRNVVPGHDRPGTRVSYAISDDGLNWGKPSDLSGPPRTQGFGWIARGFWVRDGELLGLASHFNAPGYPGKGLSLEAFRWDKSGKGWREHGTVLDDTLN